MWRFVLYASQTAACACVGWALLTGRPGVAQAQQSFPHVNDFSSTSLTNATAQFTVDTEAGVLNYADTAAAANLVATASEQITGVDGSDFVVATRFTLNETGVNTLNNSTLGFGLFGAGSTFLGNAGDPYYLADVIVNGPAIGQMRIIALPAGKAGFTPSGNFNGPEALEAGETYEIRLAGSYSGGTLTMTLQMYDAAGSPLGASGTATDTSPLTGQYFGYRNRLVNTSGTTSVSYDSFSVAEPPEGFAADFDGDDDVDGADFLIWQRNVGSGGDHSQGDANGDNLVDGVDLGIWESEFGSAEVAASAVPEPSAWALVVVSSVCLAARVAGSRVKRAR